MVTLDLQKAFDIVNHAILLAKLKALGMTTDAVNWFQSYLSDRQQIVDVNGILSNAKDVTCAWCTTWLHTRTSLIFDMRE